MTGENLLISSVFLAGLLSFFAPCTFPLIPVYIGFMTDRSGEYRKLKIGKLEINKGGIIKTIAFVLGLSTSFVILGFGAGSIGRFLNNKYLLVFAGFLVLLLGIHQMDIIHFKKLDKMNGPNMKIKQKGALGTYLMGISFSLGWTPCVGPVLAAVLVTSASSGTQFYGAFLMIIYSLGLMVPFLVMSILSGILMEKMKFFEKHLNTIKRVGGFLIALMGLVLMTNQLPNVIGFFDRLFL